jgi:hypothetical protein
MGSPTNGTTMNHSIRKNIMMARAFCLALIATILITATTAIAATAAPISPQCTGPEYRQLDFWIGDWDTFDQEQSPETAQSAVGQIINPSIARAQIKPIAQGCALHELYEQNDGLIGDSILSYDAVRKQWQQTWVTNRGALMVLWGKFKNGALVLEGEVHLSDGKTVMQRITWKAEGKGVRESAVMSKDGGKTWTPAFDVLFLKREGKAD